MKLQFARPNASELTFHLFERAVHPELFDTYAETQITAAGFEAVLRICGSGHVVEFRKGDRRLTEVLENSQQELPERGRCLSQKIRSGRDVEHSADGIAYCGSVNIERLEPEVFAELQTELEADAEQALVSYSFPSANRLVPGALSLLKVDATPNSLIVHAFHTFPDCRSIVRTQSLYEY